MSVTVEELVSACFDELQISQRFVPYIQRAEEAGFPQLAKLFRALVASETARDELQSRHVDTNKEAGRRSARLFCHRNLFATRRFCCRSW